MFTEMSSGGSSQNFSEGRHKLSKGGIKHAVNLVIKKNQLRLNHINRNISQEQKQRTKNSPGPPSPMAYHPSFSF
jgi:hypothetical protein